MVYRIHEGARFEYNDPISLLKISVIVTDIAIVTDESEVITKVYFQNSQEDHRTYMLSPREMYDSLVTVHAQQTA